MKNHSYLGLGIRLKYSVENVLPTRARALSRSLYRSRTPVAPTALVRCFKPGAVSPAPLC